MDHFRYTPETLVADREPRLSAAIAVFPHGRGSSAGAHGYSNQGDEDSDN